MRFHKLMDGPPQVDNDRLLVEQLRMLLGGVGNTVVPVLAIAVFLYWYLSNDTNRQMLGLWTVAVILSNLKWFRYARRWRDVDFSLSQARRIVGVLMAINIVGSSLWGALAWITLDTATIPESMLIFSVFAGRGVGAVSTQGPIRRLYLASIISETIVVVAKLWASSNPAHHGLIVAFLLFSAVMLGQAGYWMRTVRTSIELRFENIDLLKRLRLETLIAEEARMEAVQANIAKSRFLAAASHDLRQPIHAQGLFLEVLARTQLDPQQREMLANASAASTASADMLNTLLDFSRVEAGVVEPQMQAFRIQPLLNKIEREFEPQADAEGLAYRSRETTLVVHSDPALIELILRNLVSNAINYTENGGLLVVCRRRGRQAWLEVWDTGIGISQAHQAQVFQEFHQLGNPERDRRKGLGLGLAIVDGLTRQLGHTLSLRSTLQRGSVFRLRLPMASATMPAEPDILELHKTSMLNARVLVIDDDETVRSGMLHLLRDWGCECVAAESLEEALELARRQAPDLVISDYRLREHRTGIDAIAALRELLGKDLPALLITGDTASDRLWEARASGIPLLHKPVSPSQLYRGLVTALPPQ